MADPGALVLQIGVPDAGRVACRLEGDLDLADADRVRDALIGALAGADLVAVDASELRFVDSSGLRALHEVQAAARERGARVVLVAPRPPVERLIEMVGMRHIELSHDRSLLGPGAPGAG
jgi:anti-anti-sigma factor